MLNCFSNILEQVFWERLKLRRYETPQKSCIYLVIPTLMRDSDVN